MTVRAIPQRANDLDIERIEALIRAPGAGVLTQPTGLIWVEQPTRGYVIPLEHLARLRRLADGFGLPIHLDGARIFNASIALGVTAAEVASFADTAMFCVSKGLAAPVGSLLVGPADLIRRARVNRQMLGGGMRQAGILAAAGLYALHHNIGRLADDHANARILGGGLAALPGLRLDREVIETNIFFIESERPDLTVQQFALAMRERGVLVNVPARGRRAVRFVTHFGIERHHVEQALSIAADVVASSSPNTAPRETQLALSSPSTVQVDGN